MKSATISYSRLEIEPGLRQIILFEIIFPMVLLIIGIVAGFLQVLYRSGILHRASILGIDYYQGLTLHGTINAIVFTTFFAVAFGHAVMRFHLGKPLLSGAAWWSLILMTGGTLMAAVPMLTGKATVLYTFYPPLQAHPAFYIGLVLVVVGSWIAFFSWIPVYQRWKHENPGIKMPLGVLGIFATFIVWFIATIPVAIEIIFLLIPWSLGWVRTVNVPLARMLFWFFGHPLVYFWLLPAYVMYYTMLPKLAGGKLYSDFAGRFTFLWLIVFSAPVGLHHQYMEPAISANWKFVHTFFTMLVALPSFVTAFTLAASMEHGARERGGTGLFGWWKKLPYFDRERWMFPYLFCGLFIFIFGGITGIVNASYNLDSVVHNTSWLPAHFHQTVAGPVFLAFIGGSLLLLSTLSGKAIAFKGLNVWVPYVWTTGIMIFSLSLFYGGLTGAPRRTNMGLSYTNPASPLFRADWRKAELVGAAGGALMFLAMLMFFVVFFGTLFRAKSAAPALELPVSDLYYDEDIAGVQRLRPWLVGAAILLIVAYTMPFVELAQGRYEGAPGYDPASPVAMQR
ncbi:MAG TPA: cbb3-type cytochrome c oxidase subunit I [Thermoanaerobaculia bacterium]|nr:cbb3-type cytochrome c oxidase subunit I [Thermoanaerobaculia bacterium]